MRPSLTMLARAELLPLVISIGLAEGARGQRLIIVADTVVKGIPSEPVKLSSPGDAEREMRLLVADLQRQGHLEASCDSCVQGEKLSTCHLHVGPVYRWARLSAAEVEPEIASAARFRERYFNGRPIQPRSMARLYDDLLRLCENSGHPFAVVRLDSLRSTNGGLAAVVRLDRGPFIVIDSVLVKGDAHISRRYLEAQLGIHPGDPYDESAVRNAQARLKELPFVQQRQAPYVLFGENKAKVYLFLNAKRASSVNGILGVLPDPETGVVHFTGDLDLRLRNAFRHGEALDLNWRSLQDQTQDLKLRVDYPYLFTTPFGIEASLKLFKRDTTFLDVNARLALEYLFGRNDKVLIFVNDRSSQRLGRNTYQLPGLADVKITSYGLGLTRERYDYRFNPRRGLGIEVEGAIGRKQSSTAAPEEINVQPVRSDQLQGEGRVVWHIPLARRGTVRLVGQGGILVNDQLYLNELFRIGGVKSLRGVDEASIYASSFAIGTIEYRWLFEENSNVFVFFDQAWWEDQSATPLVTDAPFGFGLGTSFETKAGIFSISYALGSQFDGPIELRAAKVHFGFASLF